MKSYILLIVIVFGLILFSCSNNNSPNSSNTKTIDSVKIGSQVWMVKNLDVDHYQNGDIIPQVSDSTQWANLLTGAWCYYNNSDSLGLIYGKLYNWYAVNDPRGLAPIGWHVASDSEWTVLITYLGGDKVAGGNLKEMDTVHWLSPNTGATNSSGFTALPGGYRYNTATFYNIRYLGYWWSTTESDTLNALTRNIDYDVSKIGLLTINKGNGFSVRCISNY
jgi:uncharacterized protein (TIGR02145 family)